MSARETPWRRKGLLAAVAIIVAPWCFDCGSIEHGELWCEDAVAHLKACCPGFHASSLYCEHVEGCSTSKVPDLSGPEIDRLREGSCEELAASHVCERAMARSGTESDAARQEVCP